ncbi:hypothetical protein PLANPX_5587 [Lacipirellula parvula]|uniref:Uncharacterized protein n=1 Tax=Lacipirellula parvula TaxID=2650471 RepID=A0A5K7XHU5_9BACT|nr:hypothetical protein PLANPX_5587 [Lacipirellula parvula]
MSGERGDISSSIRSLAQNSLAASRRQRNDFGSNAIAARQDKQIAQAIGVLTKFVALPVLP